MEMFEGCTELRVCVCFVCASGGCKSVCDYVPNVLCAAICLLIFFFFSRSHIVACCVCICLSARFIMHSSKAVFVGGLVCFKPNQFCFRLFILFFPFALIGVRTRRIILSIFDFLFFHSRQQSPFFYSVSFGWSNEQVKKRSIKHLMEKWGKTNEMNNANGTQSANRLNFVSHYSQHKLMK